MHSRKMTLRFIFVTPRQLIEKEGKEVKQNRIPLYDRNMDLIGHKDDFRVNMQFSMATGMIGEELTHGSDLGMQSVSLCDDSSINNVTAPRQALFLGAWLRTRTLRQYHDTSRIFMGIEWILRVGKRWCYFL